jgi:hypothetical protein
MSFVVTVDSDLECPDHGRVAMPSSGKLTVSTNRVVVKTVLVGAPISGCQQVSSQQVQCLAVIAFTSGEASKLTVGSKPALLDSLAAQTAGVPNNQVTCKDPEQTKLTAK